MRIDARLSEIEAVAVYNRGTSFVWGTRALKTFAFSIFIALPLMAVAQSGWMADRLAEGERANSESRWDAAMAAYQEVRAAAIEARDTRSEAAALAGMAGAEYGLSHYEIAENLANQSLRIAERMGNRLGIAAALIQIANVQYRRGQFKEDKSTLERVLAIQEELGDRAKIAGVLNNLGNATRQLGDKLLAIEYLSRAEHEFAILGNDRAHAVVLNNIGIGYGELGDYQRGLEFSRRSLALAETLKDDSRAGNALNNIAVIETYRGNYRESLRLYEKALEADQRAGSPWAMVEVSNNIGLVYRAQQNHDQAIAYFKKTIEMNRTVGDKSLDADAYRNLGDEMISLNRFDEARVHLHESLTLAQQISYRSGEAQARLGSGSLLLRLKRLTEAGEELQKAAAIQREISDSGSLAQTQTQLSRLRLKQGRSEEALSEARQAMELLASIDRPETLWQSQLAAGRALAKLGHGDEAAREFGASIATIESLRTRIAGPPTALPVYFVDKLEPYQERVALALANRQTDAALGFTEQSKARALGDILRSGRANLDKSLTPDERETERRLQNRLAGLNLQISKQSEARLITERDRARRELDARQSELYAAHPEIAFQRGASPAMSAAQMTQVASDAGAAILNYFVTPGNTYVFVIKRGTPVRLVRLGIGRTALSAKSAEFHRQLASHDLGYTASAQDLYRLLLRPVEHDLAGQPRVVIIPEGPLWDVAFQALQPGPGHFFIEQTAVSYAPSMAVLKETIRMAQDRRATPAGRELLALGNPSGQDPLADSERQVREIEKLYGSRNSRILIGEAATQGRLKDEAANYRVLHLAAHAVLDDLNPMYSQVLLARSGGDAGTLEARELMQFQLNAEVLVLSACETARGRAPAGEGINGMLWAAFVAGAPTTVASLWRVESVSTTELMIGFHRNWLARRPASASFAKATALQQAALSLISSAKYSHPFYWAGFILVGSPN